MPTQLDRATNQTTPQSLAHAPSPGAAKPAAAPVRVAGEPNLIDSLRAGRRAERDLIPIWLLVTVFAIVWALVVSLMAPRWWPDFQLYRARANAQAGHPKDAVEWFLPLVSKNPTNITYRAELGSAYFQGGEYDKALEHYQRAQEMETALPPVETDDGKVVPKSDFNDMIGRAQLKLGRLDEAEKSLAQALSVNRLNPYANFAMGEVAVQRKDYRKAMEYFKVISQHPTLGPLAEPYYDLIEKEVFAGI